MISGRFLSTLVIVSHFFLIPALSAEPGRIDGKAAFELSTLEKKAMKFSTGPEAVSIVHFFTSDADPNANNALKWMTSLLSESSQPGLWKILFPVALHVRLADGKGHKDAFAKDDFDEMAKNYAKIWGAKRLYIPTVTVHGIEWSGWSRGQAIPPPAADKKPGVLEADGTDKKGFFNVTFTTNADSTPAGDLELHAALLGFGLQSRPSDGKNRGNLLQHDFIPVLYKRMILKTENNARRAVMELQRPRGMRASKYAVVFWVTQQENPIPLQATGGFLPTSY